VLFQYKNTLIYVFGQKYRILKLYVHLDI